MLTGNKNVDLYEILMDLDDESLIKFCKSAVKQEYEKNLCADETFWRLRTEKYYPLAYEKDRLDKELRTVQDKLIKYESLARTNEKIKAELDLVKQMLKQMLKTKGYLQKVTNLKWKDYYLRIVYYKDKMKREYGFNFTDGDAKDYYEILKYIKYIIDVKENDKNFIDFTLKNKNKNEFILKINKYKDLNQFLRKFQYYEVLHDDNDYSNTIFLPL